MNAKVNRKKFIHYFFKQKFYPNNSLNIKALKTHVKIIFQQKFNKTLFRSVFQGDFLFLAKDTFSFPSLQTGQVQMLRKNIVPVRRHIS